MFVVVLAGLLAQAAAVHAPASCSDLPSTGVTSGGDIPGGGAAKTPAACVVACDATPDCCIALFIQAYTHCYLKNSGTLRNKGTTANQTAIICTGRTCVAPPTPAPGPFARNLTVDVSAPKSAFPHAWEECVGSGHASLTMRQDWRQQLARCQRELGFKRTRFHGLLVRWTDPAIWTLPSDAPVTLLQDDDMSISIGEGRNSFVNLDSLIDFHSSIGMTPLFELSFMPQWLAQPPLHTTCHYRGITSPPTNYTKWGNLIEQIATHLLHRYGEEKCKTFFFEVREGDVHAIDVQAIGLAQLTCDMRACTRNACARSACACVCVCVRVCACVCALHTDFSDAYSR